MSKAVMKGGCRRAADSAATRVEILWLGGHAPRSEYGMRSRKIERLRVSEGQISVLTSELVFWRYN